jgi:hypothetical protein
VVVVKPLTRLRTLVSTGGHQESGPLPQQSPGGVFAGEGQTIA